MKKTIVAYFSASGKTKEVAAKLATGLAVELFMIAPESVYSSADLDWQNPNSRSSLEMMSLNSRPKISNKIADFEQYDLIFIGFPIWWYREPSIIDTFLESYDFRGKTIVPFATSGGSGMQECIQRFKQIVPQSIIKEGKLILRGMDHKDVLSWARQYLSLQAKQTKDE